MLERDYPAAERYLREAPAEDFPITDTEHLKLTYEALLAVARNADPAIVEHALVTARQEIEKFLADAPTDARLHGYLGLIDAFRGRKEDVLRLPKGDGMVLAIFTSPDAPVRCALQLPRG